MTHPIVEAVAAKLREQDNYPGRTQPYATCAREIVAEVLRLAPAALPSNMMTSGPMTFRNAWRAGIDALLREVEGGR